LTKTDTEDRAADENNTTTYTYDNVGNRLSENNNEDVMTYVYNSLNQLTSSQTIEGETTDDDGNEINNVISQKAYTYDANGNETEEKDSATGADISSTYDAENRLESLKKTVDNTVNLTQEYTYDGEGQRIEKSNTEANGDKTSTNYYYQNGTVLSTDTTKGSSTTQSSFNLLGTESNESNVICSERSDGKYYFYNKDLQGSTSNVIGTDSDGNAESEVSYVYGDFGETTINNSSDYNKGAGSDFYNEICYTGGIYDKDTGLYYLNARYYDPEDADFTTQDTYRGDVNNPDTLNLYSYCMGDPINFIDPSGHSFESLYSRLSSAQKKKLRKKERDALKLVPSKKYHFSRNRYNTGLPATMSVAKAHGWEHTSGDWAHQFNKKKKKIIGKIYTVQKNKKYFKGVKEVIFHYDGSKDNTPEDRGSYNYGSDGLGPKHTLKDVVPWIAWGNSSTKYGNNGNDKTTPIMRHNCVPQTFFNRKAIRAIRALKKLKMYDTVKN